MKYDLKIKKEKNIIDISNEPENITYELRDTCNTTDKPFTYGDEKDSFSLNDVSWNFSSRRIFPQSEFLAIEVNAKLS